MTFKISIDETTELGKYLSQFTPRQRNNQLIELATIGLTWLTSADTAPISAQTKPSKAQPLVETQSLLVESAPQPTSISQGGLVDFGNDLMMINN